MSPTEEPMWLFHLFVNEKFTFHRLFGFLYLVQYAVSLYLYLTDYAAFSSSIFIWSLPLNGVVQSLTATYYFSFLTTKNGKPGYFGDKGTLSYPFVKENIFFGIIMLFGWLYMSDTFYSEIKHGVVFELLFVFLPYAILRPWFPKTSFREGISEGNKSESNRDFFYYLTWVTKLFYPYGKWIIGFYLNYLRYADKLTPYHRQKIYGTLFGGSWSITIAIFTHTLRFKGYISARTSFGLYVASYLTTFIFAAQIADVFVASPLLLAFAMVGCLLNCIVFAPVWAQNAAQAIIMVLMWAHRERKLDLATYWY